MKRIGALIAVTMLLAMSVTVQGQERNGLESITPYFQARTVNLNDGLSHDIRPVEIIKIGENEALRFFVESRDVESRMMFRDYIQIWGLEVGDPVETVSEITTIIYQTVQSVTRSGPFVPDNPGTVSVFFSETSDGRIFSSGTTYVGAQTCVETCIVETGQVEPGSNIWRGLSGPPIEYLIVTSYHVFDTSPIQSSHTISNVDLEFFKSAGTSHLNSDDQLGIVIEIRGYDWGPTLDSGDWFDFTNASNWTDLEFLGYFDAPIAGTSVVNMPVTTSSNLLGYVNKSGTTQIVASYNASYTTNPPILDQDIFLTRWAHGSNATQSLRPRLTVTHSFVPPTPTPSPTPIPVSEIVITPGSFTPVIWMVGFLAGLVFIGYGERNRQGTYIFVGALMLIASSVGMGIVILMVLSGLAFFPLTYRGYLLISQQTSGGGFE